MGNFYQKHFVFQDFLVVVLASRQTETPLSIASIDGYWVVKYQI